MTRTFPLVIGVLLLAGLFYVGRPFLGCWYNHHRFEQYVHVQIDLSSCGEAPSDRPCRYIFSFEGADGPEAFQFAGADLHHSYDQVKRTYIVGGAGRVAYRNNVIELASTNVLFNNQSLPQGSTQPILALVKNDGQLASGYCDVSW